MTKRKTITVLLLVAFAILSCFDVRYLTDVLLNHIGTIIILALLVVDISKNFLTWFTFLCISIFCFFHIIGARYLYSFVPYNDWSINLFGWDIQQFFGCTRNHYDRFVHFIFGILIFPFFVEWFTRKNKMIYSQALLFTWLCIQTFSMMYELIEWLVALLLSEKTAENYNGQQGDIWDAHKDMALAMLGSTVMFLYCRIKPLRK